MYAILPVLLVDGLLATDATPTGVQAGYSAESQAEARAHCLTLHPTAVGTVREHIGSDDGPDTAVMGPDGAIVGYLGCAPSTGETLTLPADHAGHAYCDPAFLAASIVTGAVAHAERLVSELEEAARLQVEAVETARTAWIRAPKDAQGLSAPEIHAAWSDAAAVGDRVSAALLAARSALIAVQDAS